MSDSEKKRREMVAWHEAAIHGIAPTEPVNSKCAESHEAHRCDGCLRMRYDVRRTALFLNGVSAAERDLCAACRSEAIDGFLQAAAR